jgi:hypothetical protein
MKIHRGEAGRAFHDATCIRPAQPHIRILENSKPVVDLMKTIRDRNPDFGRTSITKAIAAAPEISLLGQKRARSADSHVRAITCIVPTGDGGSYIKMLAHASGNK